MTCRWWSYDKRLLSEGECRMLPIGRILCGGGFKHFGELASENRDILRREEFEEDRTWDVTSSNANFLNNHHSSLFSTMAVWSCPTFALAPPFSSCRERIVQPEARHELFQKRNGCRIRWATHAAKIDVKGASLRRFLAHEMRLVFVLMRYVAGAHVFECLFWLSWFGLRFANIYIIPTSHPHRHQHLVFSKRSIFIIAESGCFAICNSLAPQLLILADFGRNF